MNPPPPPNRNESPPPSNKGCKWLAVGGCVLSLILVVAIGIGTYLVVNYARENRQKVRQVANSMQPARMQPEFLELLNAISSTLETPSSEQAIGKVDQQGSDPYLKKAKLLLVNKKYQDLDKLLSACYKGKLMTKQGFFIYRKMIDALVETKGLRAWVKATDS
ncbi:MAG: hypothetical protein L3J39_15525, partial [Verrucomicrobiales bacterium]|nr:hypothetical protein [Verrucomicrobiales bacterium]